MYKCYTCNHLFEEGEQSKWVEKHGLSTPPYEEQEGCPLCKGDFFEIEPCPLCGGYDHYENEVFCFECKKKTEAKFVKLMAENFTKEERKLLNELYDGRDI
jgi:hypothetical protein